MAAFLESESQKGIVYLPLQRLAIPGQAAAAAAFLLQTGKGKERFRCNCFSPQVRPAIVVRPEITSAPIDLHA
jgi:hypothetical protein